MKRWTYEQLKEELASRNITVGEFCRIVALESEEYILPRDLRHYCNRYGNLSRPMSGLCKVIMRQIDERNKKNGCKKEI